MTDDDQVHPDENNQPESIWGDVPDPEAAEKIDHEAREWDKQYVRQFARLGPMLLRFKVRELWRYLHFHSFDSWLLDAMPVSHSTAYSAIKVALILSYIPEEERALMAPGNLRTLAEVADEKVVQNYTTDAKQMKPAEFRAKVVKEHPELHIENFKPMQFKPAEGQRGMIEEGIAKAKLPPEEGGDGALTREEALCAMAFHYVYGRPEVKPVSQAEVVQ